jgi:hypothetical protein
VRHRRVSAQLEWRRGSACKWLPSSQAAPSIGRHNPPSKRNNVLLPDPFGPMSASNAPPRKTSETPRTIQRPSRRSPAFCNSSFIVQRHSRR